MMKRKFNKTRRKTWEIFDCESALAVFGFTNVSTVSIFFSDGSFSLNCSTWWSLSWFERKLNYNFVYRKKILHNFHIGNCHRHWLHCLTNATETKKENTKVDGVKSAWRWEKRSSLWQREIASTVKVWCKIIKSQLEWTTMRWDSSESAAAVNSIIVRKRKKFRFNYDALRIFQRNLRWWMSYIRWRFEWF